MLRSHVGLPEATPDQPGVEEGPAGRRHLAVAGMLLAATYVFAFRRIGVVTSPYFWAEDAAVFLKDAMASGAGSLYATYNGQYFFLQRVTAYLGAQLPVPWEPTLYVAVGTAAAVLSCGWVLSPRWRFEVPLGLRFAVMLGLLCSPTVDEVHGNLTNAHWWLAIGLVLIGLLRDPVGRGSRGWEIGYVTVASLTGFSALYGLPTLVARALRTRTRHSSLLCGIAAVALALQTAILLASHQRQGRLGVMFSEPSTLWVVPLKRVFGAMALGDQYLSVVWPADVPTWWVIPLVGVVVAAFVVLLASTDRLVAIALVAVAAVGVVLAFWATTMDPLTPAALIAPGAASRYFVIPVAAMYIAAAVVERWSGITAAAGVTLALVCLVAIAGEYRIPGDTMFDQSPFYACMQKDVGTCSTTVPPGWTITVATP